MKKKVWITWLRDNGRWSIAHLLKRTRNGKDYTVCGMNYPATTLKQLWDFAKCEDCNNGKMNKTNIRSSMKVGSL